MKEIRIGVIGLGYVGLPLATLFAQKYNVVGFDIDEQRVCSLSKGIDDTLEVSSNQLETILLKEKNNDEIGLFCSINKADLEKCNVYIITVPTPVDKNNRAVLLPLLNASKMVGGVLKAGDVVVYESTVYPGVTEEECVPVLEEVSGLKFNVDFFVGYSPERVNPGDKKNTIETILKVTSGSNQNTAIFVDKLYKSIIKAGTHRVSSIKVAEASKVIENSQRDINIAFVNELAKIFGLMNIDTHEVLEAAATKWNFLPFKPGLVGGHCIGVDPYYLVQRAEEFGYHPGVILAGRRINDSMGEYVASQVVKLMIEKDVTVKNADVLILGVSFKENCPDVRNSKVIDVIKSLREYNTNITVYDSWVSSEKLKEEIDVNLINELPNKKFDVIVLAVAHNEFKMIDLELLKKQISVVYDVKGFLSIDKIDKRL